jgi:AcrR family transcriptional regulator
MPLRRLPQPPPRLEASLEAEGVKPRKKKTAKKSRFNGRTKPPQQRHTPSDETRKMISNMASYGLDALKISKLSGLSTATIYKYYRHEMMTAADQKDLIVLQSAFLKAIGGPDQNWEKADAAQQRWWIAIRQRWQLPATTAINANMNMDLSRLTDRQLDELERIMEAASEMDDRGYPEGKIIPPE